MLPEFCNAARISEFVALGRTNGANEPHFLRSHGTTFVADWEK